MPDSIKIGKISSPIELMDETKYIVAREGFQWSESWDTVIAHKRIGGAKIGKALWSELNLQFGLWIKGATYQIALDNMNALKDVLKDAHIQALGTNPIYYTESLANQTTPLTYLLLHGTLVHTDRTLIHAGIIRAAMDLTLTPS